MHEIVQLTLFLLALPLLSFVLLIFSQRAMRMRAHLVGIPLMTFGVLLSIYISYLKIKGLRTAAIEYNFEWLSFGNVPGVGEWPLKLGIMVDNMTAILLVVVFLVSALVHLYSSEYMKGDVRYARYYAYLGLFTFSMVGIVLSNNLLALFMFWELVGFSSYSLISHWYEKPGPYLAAKKAFIVNRIGDVTMLIGMLILFAQFHTFTLTEIFDMIAAGIPPTFSIFNMYPNDTLTLAGILIFCGAIGKSAQFPLHVWLPDAMEGPTPVSALIHAATMVAAGVYLTARIFPMLTADAMFIIACVGGITAVIGAVIAITQNDIKRILAYSTVSQLGYMIMAIGVGAFSAGFFHLVTHAMFKACLFLGAGSVIYAMHHSLHYGLDHETDPQDIYNMGGMLKKMPITGWTFIVSTLALAGIPLFSGFMSKDEILAGVTAYGELNQGVAIAMPYVGFVVAFLTALYMGKLLIKVFLGEPKRPEVYEHVHESPLMMRAPLIALAALSIWIWYGLNPVDPAKGWFMAKWVTTPGQIVPKSAAPPYAYTESAPVKPVTPAVDPELEEELRYIPEEDKQVSTVQAPLMTHQRAMADATRHVAWSTALMSLGVALGGLLFAWLIYLRKPGISAGLKRGLGPIHRLSYRKLYFDEIYDFLFVDTMLLLSRIVAWFDENVIDRIVNMTSRVTLIASKMSGWFDKFVVDGIVSLIGGVTQFFGLMLRTVQTGKVQTYIGVTLTCVIIMIFLVRYFFVGV
ncbi:MAG TPA: NADH-quinone oxidoreductase subunit L [Candidatus Kapabacteria bacterium]|nr:NADH-quinone oxidoreductase subunit L [Candidatus Kapabacteria bacterium]